MPDEPLPIGARRLGDDELPAITADAAIEFEGTLFSLFDGVVGWDREDGERPSSFDPADIQCMAVLAGMVESE